MTPTIAEIYNEVLILRQLLENKVTLQDRNFNLEEAADYLRVNKKTIIKYVTDGLLPAHKLGKKYLFKKSELDSSIETIQL